MKLAIAALTSQFTKAYASNTLEIIETLEVFKGYSNKNVFSAIRTFT